MALLDQEQHLTLLITKLYLVMLAIMAQTAPLLLVVDSLVMVVVMVGKAELQGQDAVLEVELADIVVLAVMVAQEPQAPLLDLVQTDQVAALAAVQVLTMKVVLAVVLEYMVKVLVVLVLQLIRNTLVLLFIMDTQVQEDLAEHQAQIILLPLELMVVAAVVVLELDLEEVQSELFGVKEDHSRIH